ncbi:hypothetical protein CIW83_14735 [Tissierella sp. P1]|jgi:hypothetical protein|uniref:hypothetical protein n=1 Tax=Tissierella TaxID=41273 RepID=UPI000BA01989|nr:hypothetical protein [Tissierella sp. P1]OZV11388.1 hypothetical protein CIW83_14735 [Tissierella sp. P1]
MRITGSQFKFNNFMQDNKRNIGFKPWNSKTIISGQNIFGFNIKQNKDKKVDNGGNIGDMMSKKIRDDIIADKIAKKIARGENITAEERAMLMEMAPDKLEKAMQASKRRKEIESRIKTAKTKKEAREIILQARVEAKIAFDKIDKVYGEYFMEAVNKIEEDYSKKNIKDNDDITKLGTDKEKTKGIDIKL